ncbi:MAG TPA: 2-amino-4-hydroxy-6-hydroxymethyldihydropteridine diphosphokinase [Acidimicrobiales bacterium]|nr:2-amino-4-hydroxy-6-hydroxymethyldihydropteridine diphosphokinase [Acidimicrobiales bacterium]
MRAFLGLGANLGDRRSQLREAVSALPGVVAVSSLYETEPIGGPAGQPSYLNVVVELETDLAPRQLMELAQALEAAAGRVRGVRWGPRSLDVDVLLAGDLVVEEEDLVVPHPRMWERRFVLEPLAELAPKLVPRELLEAASGEVVKVGALSGG